MHQSARGSAAAVLALSALLAVSGCTGSGNGSGNGGVNGGDSGSTAAAGAPSSTAGAPGAGATAGATPSTAPTVAPSTSPSKPVLVFTSTAPTASAGCRDLPATAAVKAAVIAAYQGRFPYLTRIETAPGSFFYGVCGTTGYVLTQFRSTSGASEQQLVAMQDEGSARKLLEDDNGSGWRYVSSDSFPGTPGCVGAVPSGLVTVWGNCPFTQ